MRSTTTYQFDKPKTQVTVEQTVTKGGDFTDSEGGDTVLITISDWSTFPVSHTTIRLTGEQAEFMGVSLRLVGEAAAKAAQS